MEKTRKESTKCSALNGRETKNSLNTNRMVDDGIFLYYQQRHRKILYAEILWIEASGSYCRIHMTEQRQIFFVYTLGKLYDMLPQDRFVRIHRSFIVNIYAVTAFIHKILYIGETQLIISTPYLANVMSYFKCVDNRKLSVKQEELTDKQNGESKK